MQRKFANTHIQALASRLALLLFLASQFSSAAALICVFAADAHGHDHDIAFRMDGGHIDVVMSHHTSPHETHSEPLTSEDQAALCLLHDHQNNAHVLHFSSGHDTLKSRVGIQSPSPKLLLALATPARSPLAQTTILPHQVVQPALPDGLLGVRTTVLLI